MSDGINDISNLFSRVSALEQEDVDSDRTVAKITKFYPVLGLKVTFKINVHQYPICNTTTICGSSLII